METVSCYLCGNDKINNIIISQHIVNSDETFDIHECSCTFKFLNPRPTIEASFRAGLSELSEFEGCHVEKKNELKK